MNKFKNFQQNILQRQWKCLQFTSTDCFSSQISFSTNKQIYELQHTLRKQTVNETDKQIFKCNF